MVKGIRLTFLVEENAWAFVREERLCAPLFPGAAGGGLAREYAWSRGLIVDEAGWVRMLRRNEVFAPAS